MAKIKYNDNYVKPILPLTEGQKDYLQIVAENIITFCVGPSGSGKTRVAVGIAINWLFQNRAERIIISRPIISAGVKDIGALPGTMEEKISPYLQPIYDELLEHATIEQLIHLKKQRELEVVPIDYMRGRTFKNSIIIIDEAQNLTLEQLKMCLTRIGHDSKMIIVGDLAQSDLPRSLQGGLKRCIDKLSNIVDIGIVKLESIDVVRHHLIPIILERLL